MQSLNNSGNISIMLLGAKEKPKPMITLTYLTQKECRTSKKLGVLCLFIDLILTLLISTL